MLDNWKNDELMGSIVISLFTDARATDEEFADVSDREPSKRGYWADQLEGTISGSKLWLLNRKPRDNETIEKAKVYAFEALEWMVKDGLVKQIDINVSWNDDDLLIELALDTGKKHQLRYVR